MSTLLVGRVWELDLPHNLAWVLMAMVDHADAEGKHIYPGLRLLAWKTGYSPRQVSTIVAELLERGILRVDQQGGGRGRPTEYSAYLDCVPRKPAVRDKRCVAMVDTDLPALNHAETARFTETLQFEGLNLAVSGLNLAETLQSARGNRCQSLTVNLKGDISIDRTVIEVWDLARTQLRLQMTKSTYETWVRDTRPLGCDDAGAFEIGVPNQYAHDWLTLRLRPTIKRTLTNIAGRPLEPIFTVQASLTGGSHDSRS